MNTPSTVQRCRITMAQDEHDSGVFHAWAEDSRDGWIVAEGSGFTERAAKRAATMNAIAKGYTVEAS